MKNTTHTLLLLLALLCSSCTFPSTATHWSGRVDPDGVPIYVKTTTNVGVNLFIALPVLGDTTLDKMVRRMTEEISEENGDGVSMVESSSENYWYGWSPLTWIVTPVVTTVTFEYRPSAEELKKLEAERAKEKADEEAEKADG